MSSSSPAKREKDEEPSGSLLYSGAEKSGFSTCGLQCHSSKLCWSPVARPSSATDSQNLSDLQPFYRFIGKMNPRRRLDGNGTYLCGVAASYVRLQIQACFESKQMQTGGIKAETESVNHREMITMKGKNGAWHKQT